MAIDQTRCPLCNSDNHCAAANQQDSSHCWCLTVNFPPQLLDQVPTALKRQSCICQHCAEKANQLAKEIS